MTDVAEISGMLLDRFAGSRVSFVLLAILAGGILLLAHASTFATGVAGASKTLSMAAGGFLYADWAHAIAAQAKKSFVRVIVAIIALTNCPMSRHRQS